MRPQLEINRELALLRDLKLRVPKRGTFGNDNYGAITAQIEVLETLITDAKIMDRGDSRKTAEELLWQEDVRDCALDAYAWKLGRRGAEAPSKDWIALAGTVPITVSPRVVQAVLRRSAVARG